MPVRAGAVTDGEEHAQGRRLDPRVVRTRETVLGAGRALLLGEGWEALTHARLAERAGVGRATLYRHWPTQAALLREVLSDLAVMRAASVSGDLRADLVNELEGIRLQLAEPGLGHVVATLIERAEWEEDLRALRVQTSRRGIEPLRALVLAGVRDGQLRADLDVALAVARLVAVVFFERFFAVEPLPANSVEEVVDDFLARSVAGAATGPT